MGLQSSIPSRVKYCPTRTANRIPNTSKYFSISFFEFFFFFFFWFAFATLFVHRVNLLRPLYLISVRLSNFAQVINANSLTTFHTHAHIHTHTHRHFCSKLHCIVIELYFPFFLPLFPSQIFASWFDAHVEQLLRYIGQLDRSRYGHIYGAQSDNAQRSGAIMRAAYVILIFQCCIKFGWHFLTIPDAD